MFQFTFFDELDIFCAASEGHVDVIKELLTCSNPKPLLQGQDVNGNTPLHFASYPSNIFL
jgi:hypothetical protein